MKAKIATGAAMAIATCGMYWPKKRLQLLDAVDHRQHDAAGALGAEPGRTEGDDLVVQQPAQRLLHAHGGAVRDHGAAVVERGAQHDGDAGARQRPDQRGGRRALEHAGEEAAEEHEAGDAEAPAPAAPAATDSAMRQR